MTNPNTHTIACQNDQFRQELKVSLRRMHNVTLPGAYATTSTVGALSRARYFELIHEVVAFDTFTEVNDPHGEHDFGGVTIAGDRYFWKIDYYANDTCEWGSEDPSDPRKCFRVMTIMHASEY